MRETLLYLCKALDGREKTANKLINTKCEEFLDSFLISYQSIFDPIFFTILLFTTIFIISVICYEKFFNLKKNKLVFFVTSLFFIFYLTIIIKFPTELIWVDDWAWINNIQFKEISDLEWIFTGANIHFIVLPKILYLINNQIFQLNFAFYNYLSLILILLTTIIFLIKNNKLDFSLLLLIVILIFNGKQFPNFTQASNISWIICLLFIVLFSCNYKNTSYKNIIYTSFSITFSPMTLGIGFIVPIYALIVLFFLKLENRIKLIYFLLAIFSLSISYYIPHSQLLDPQSYNYLSNLFSLNFYLIFFGVLSNIYLPWLKNFGILGTFIGIFQILVILKILLSNFNLKKVRFFILENPYLIMGILFAGLVALTRPTNLATISAARYSTGSIIFQIGFWIFVFHNINHFNFKKSVLIKFLSIYLFVLGVYAPYFGFHWQIVRSNFEAKIINCFKNNDKIDFCKKQAYEILMYNGDWYEYEKFSFQIDSLIENKKSLFRNTNK